MVIAILIVTLSWTTFLFGHYGDQPPPTLPLVFSHDTLVATVTITLEQWWKIHCIFLLLQWKLLSEMEIRYLLHLHIILQTTSDP